MLQRHIWDGVYFKFGLLVRQSRCSSRCWLWLSQNKRTGYSTILSAFRSHDYFFPNLTIKCTSTSNKIINATKQTSHEACLPRCVVLACYSFTCDEHSLQQFCDDALSLQNLTRRQRWRHFRAVIFIADILQSLYLPTYAHAPNMFARLTRRHEWFLVRHRQPGVYTDHSIFKDECCVGGLELLLSLDSSAVLKLRKWE